MGTTKNLENFLRLYNSELPAKDPVDLRAVQARASMFKKNCKEALAYIAGIDDEDDRQAAKVLINKNLSGTWAWTKVTKDFKIVVNWQCTTNEFPHTLLATLNPLIDELNQQSQGMRADNPNRELYVLLLAHLLRIYFVKAANIATMVDKLETLPFVERACPKPKDYPALKNDLTHTYNPRNSACRGFQVDAVGDIVFLALVFNPEDTEVPDPMKTAQKDELARIKHRIEMRASGGGIGGLAIKRYSLRVALSEL